jgi:26S proteasome regulatory subunit N6
MEEPAVQASVEELKSLVLSATNDAEALKSKEQSISALTDLLVKNRDAIGLRELLSQLRPFFNTIPKAKTAKIVRSVIDSIAKIPGSTELQVTVVSSVYRLDF